MQPGFATQTWSPTTAWLIALLISLPSATAFAQEHRANAGTTSLERPRGEQVDALRRDGFNHRQIDLLATPFLARQQSTPTGGDPAPAIRLRTGSTATSVDIGDTLTFNVPRTLSNSWESKHFTLTAESAEARLWVATDELVVDSVRQTDIDALMQTITQQTPVGSYDPERGIVAIASEVFGPTRDYDGDGLVDILWFDIFDDYGGPGTVFTPVIVAADDIDPAATPGIGNQADVIYLDTYPTLNGPEQDIDIARANLAGGYQALVHLNHDEAERTFVRVGLFEWIKVLLGFPGPTTRYAEQPGEHNIDFLSYAGVIGDRERATLFMRYVADQLGVGATGVLTRSPEVGEAGLAAMLAASADGRTVGEFVTDFHTANLVQDKSLDPRFGYADPELPSPIARPTVRIDASLNQGLSGAPVLMQAGGVQYVQWQNVLDIEIRVDAVDAANRPRLRARAFVESASGENRVVDLDIQASPQLVAGANDRVTLVLMHGDLSAPPVSVTVGAEWVGTAYETTNVVYDDGEFADSAINFVTLGDGWIQAVRFRPPTGTVLQKVFVPVVYLNQFTIPGTNQYNGLPQDPRDFTLTVYRDNGFGLPGDTLFQRTVVDPRPYGPSSGASLPFLEVDLDGEEIGGLGESAIFIGLSEAGSDTNSLMLGLSTFSDEDVSLVFGPIGGQPKWFDLWNLEVGGQSLMGYSIPVRAQFRASEPVGIASAEIRSDELALHSFPNPATDVAHIVLETQSASGAYEAHLVDVLGRRVRSLQLPPGIVSRVEFDLDVSTLAAGLYFLHVAGSTNSGTHRSSHSAPIVVAR